MVTQLAFPLGMPLGGNDTLNVREIPIKTGGGRIRRIAWDTFDASFERAYIIAIDGQPFVTVANSGPVDIRIEPVLDSSFAPTPIIQIKQIPIGYSDKGFFIPEYFDAVLPDKINVTFNAPAVVTDIESYNVYWDKGSGTVEFTDDFIMAKVLEDGSTSYSVWSPSLTTGTYKFVVQAVDEIGNRSVNIAELSQVIATFPSPVSGFTATLNAS